MPVNTALGGTDATNLALTRGVIEVNLSVIPWTSVASATISATPSSTPVTSVSTSGESANWLTAPRANMLVKITNGSTVKGYYRVRLVPIAGTAYIDEVDTADPGMATILSRTAGIVSGDTLTIYEVYLPHSVKPYTDSGGTSNQDYAITVGTHNSAPDLICNCAINGYPGDYVTQVANGATQAISAVITPQRWPTSTGSTITYAWSYPASFTGVSGGATATLTATAPVGSHFIYCVVTDSIAGAFTVIRWIRIHSPADPPLRVRILQGNNDSRDKTSRSVKFKLVNSRAMTIPPGTQGVLWGTATWNSADVVSAAHSFSGFIFTAPYQQSAMFDVQTLEMIGIGQMLDRLAGYPAQWSYNGTTSTWTALPASLQNIYFLIWWLLRWRTANILSRYNFTARTYDGSVGRRKIISVGSGTVLSQLKALAEMYDANVGSRSDGEITVQIDPAMLTDRTSVITRTTLDYSMYGNLNVTWQQRPVLGLLKYDGFTSDLTADVPVTVQVPGARTSGQAGGTKSQRNKIFDSETDALARTGMAWSIENNEYPAITLDLPDNWDIFEPVDRDRVIVNLPASRVPSGAPTSITCSVEKVTKTYLGRRAKISLTLKGETYGVPGVIVPQPPPGDVYGPGSQLPDISVSLPDWGTDGTNVPVNTSTAKGCLLATADGYVARGGWTDISPTAAQRAAIGTCIKMIADPWNYKGLILYGAAGALMTADSSVSAPSWKLLNLAAAASLTWSQTFDFSTSSGSWVAPGDGLGGGGAYSAGVGWVSSTASNNYNHVYIYKLFSSAATVSTITVTITHSAPTAAGGNLIYSYDGTTATVIASDSSANISTLTYSGPSTSIGGVFLDIFGSSPFDGRTSTVTKVVITGTGANPFGGSSTSAVTYIGDIVGSINQKGYFGWLTKRTVSGTDYVYYNWTTNYWSTRKSTQVATYSASETYTISMGSYSTSGALVVRVTAGTNSYISTNSGTSFSSAATTLTAGGGFINIPYAVSGGASNAGTAPQYALVLGLSGGFLKVRSLAGSTVNAAVTASSPVGPYALGSFTTDGKYLTLVLQDGTNLISSDAGATWSAGGAISGSGNVYGCTGSPQNHSFLLAFGATRLSFSSNFATSWSNLYTSYDTFRSGAYGSGGTTIISAFIDLNLLYSQAVTQ